MTLFGIKWLFAKQLKTSSVVYTERFVCPIYRPDRVGAQILLVFWQPMNDWFIEIKIDPIKKIACIATDFLKSGRHQEKAPCQSKGTRADSAHNWRILDRQREDLLRKEV